MSIRARESGNKSSIGNKHYLSQQITKLKKNKSTEEPTKSADSIQMELLSDEFSSCCNRNEANAMCCILKYFLSDIPGCTKINSINWDSCLKFVEECQAITKFKNEDEKNDYLEEIFRNCIIQQPLNESKQISSQKQSSENPLKMDYKLPDNKKVCRKVFAYVYGYTEYSIRQCSKAVKEGVKNRIYRLKTFTDDQIHDYNHYEVAKIFKESVKVAG
jgi:hypothetical protein